MKNHSVSVDCNKCDSSYMVAYTQEFTVGTPEYCVFCGEPIDRMDDVVEDDDYYYEEDEEETLH